jgi:hypothetical protein
MSAPRSRSATRGAVCPSEAARWIAARLDLLLDRLQVTEGVLVRAEAITRLPWERVEPAAVDLVQHGDVAGKLSPRRPLPEPLRVIVPEVEEVAVQVGGAQALGLVQQPVPAVESKRRQILREVL